MVLYNKRKETRKDFKMSGAFGGEYTTDDPYKRLGILNMVKPGDYLYCNKTCYNSQTGDEDFIKGKKYLVKRIFEQGLSLYDEKETKHDITIYGWFRHFLTNYEMREKKFKRICR